MVFYLRLALEALPGLGAHFCHGGKSIALDPCRNVFIRDAIDGDRWLDCNKALGIKCELAVVAPTTIFLAEHELSLAAIERSICLRKLELGEDPSKLLGKVSVSSVCGEGHNTLLILRAEFFESLLICLSGAK